jgi:NCS1 family nucleobase:cation symporter-1
MDIIGFNNVWIWFFVFQAFQIYLSAKGIQSIKWVEIVGSIVIMLGVVYLIFLFLSTFGFEVKQSTNIEGSWGIPFWLAMAVLIGQFSALLINISDYTRYFPRKSNAGTFVGAHIVGIVPPMILLPFVGILGAAAVGIWNPVDIISEHISSLFASIVILVFIALAQITTNLVANIMPPVLVLGVLTCPWWIMTDSSFLTFISIVSAFLGPIFAVMVVDYYLVHKGNYNLTRLYDVKSLFSAFKGWNPAAIISIGVGTVFSFMNVDLSWLLGIIPAGYHLFCSNEILGCEA